MNIIEKLERSFVMSDMNVNAKEALAAAVEMEKKGYDFFNRTAEKAENHLAREVFSFLAAEELNHIKAIEKFSRDFLSAEFSGVESAIDELKAGRPKKAIEDLFKSLTESVPLDGGDIQAYQFAMDFERKGGEFYKKAAAAASEPNTKMLFEFLVGEERNHFKIVESCLLYFDNPEEFFHQREGWHLEG